MSIRICVVQYQLRPIASFDDFAAQCRYFVTVAGNYQADFVLFPEMLTNQLLSLHPGIASDEAVDRLDQYTERYLALFKELAVGQRVNVIGGSHFTKENGRRFNISYLFGRDGTVGRQYKLHVTPGERAIWGIEAGDRIEVFDTDRGPVAIQICYDVEFPEPTRIATARGARLLFVPFCTDDRQGHLRVRYCAAARCIENQIYVATAGLVGNLRGVREMDVHYAQSAILTPSDFGFARDGIAGECEPNAEMIVVQDVDPARLEHARSHGTVKNWLDRRTDLYEVVLKR